MGNRRALGWIFLAVFAGFMLWWTQTRRPRDCVLQIDLTQAMPGDVAEVDVVVRRDGHALARHDVRYDSTGAPWLVEMRVHAVPGDAQVETTLVYAGKPARRSVAQTTLAEAVPARVRAP